MKRIWMLALVLTGLLGCATGVSRTSAAPPESWRLGFFAPNYMEMWVEEAHVIDVRSDLYPRSGGGTVALGYTGDPTGWPARVGAGSGLRIRGADLPARIYVRWQSLVEPQTYQLLFDVPDEVRRLMRQREPQPQYLPARKMQYRNYLILGLAPGGVVKVWNGGTGLDSIEVMCLQASVVPEGPYGGKSGGRHRPLSDKAVPYVQANPIPYDSWKCDTD